MTYADDPNPIPVDITVVPTSRQSYKRSVTMVQTESNNDSASAVFPPPEASLNTEAPPEDDFSILRLDLNLGVTRQAKTLINRLERASIASLLDNRFTAALDHLDLLRIRIHDAQSRVLVTGDLNAGKSTLVNALLRRHEVMPTDEQPLTTRFVEVVNADENAGLEEIHLQNPKIKYNIHDRSSFTVEPIERLAEIISDAESDASSPSLTVYLKGNTVTSNPSILHNGVVDISLIDAPGLNRDSIKTTANFARQEEIDVIVFVVSAANHFTLSAKEFIWQAGHEKAHLFIVVNRFDQIRDKERCRRLVLEQIKQLSPETYKDAADLVHFVDSAKVAFGLGEDEAADIDETFSHLEHSLRSFVLVNRSKSKLGPARNYALRLLSDVELLASANSIVAIKERDSARGEAARIKPILDEMRKGKESLESALGAEEESAIALTASQSKSAMECALDRVGQGLPATAGTLELPPYPGLLAVWDYAQETRRVLLSSLESTIRLVEVEARQTTTETISRMTTIGRQYLPSDVEPLKKQFRPESMFSQRIPGSAVAVVGLKLTSQNQFKHLTVSDIIDINHLFTFASGQLAAANTSKDLIPYAAEMSGLGAASLTFGALLLNSHSYGVKSMIDSTVRLAELASSPVARKWAGPVLGALSLGIAAYIVYDLPQSIPRSVGRRLQGQLQVSSGLPGDQGLYPLPDAVSKYVEKEVRKVTRKGTWIVSDQHRVELEARSRAYNEYQGVEKKANDALAHFKAVDQSAQKIREKVDLIKI